MIKNYFKIAWRNINKHRFYAAINVLGLFTGVVFTLLIGAYVWGELQVNRTLKNSDRQYFLLSKWEKSNMGVDFATLGPLAKRLKEDYPSLVANYYRFDGISTIISRGEKRFREGIQLGDASLLTMFGFELLHGNKETAFKNPHSVVISTDKARKYFNKEDAVGETITIQNFNGEDHNFNVTGVFKELPENSVTHINNENSPNAFLAPEFFMPTSIYAFFDRADFDSWQNVFIPSYIELKAGVSADDLKTPIEDLISQHASEEVKRNLTVSAISLTDFYLEKDDGLVKGMLYTLSIIGLFILLMAIVNFINISISMSGSRMKEIGVRKVLGGVRRQLICQFLVESFILVLIATILALFAFSFLRPLLNDIVATEIPKLSTFPLSIVFILLLFVFVVSVLSGLYPAFVLSSLKSIESLKGKLQTKNVPFQRSLVGFQFSIALFILISAFIITQQVDYFFDKDLGYNKDFVLSAQVPRDWTDDGVEKMEVIRNEFESLPYITKSSLSFEIPNGNNGRWLPLQRLEAPSDQVVRMVSLSVDDHYIETYQIPLMKLENLGNSSPSKGQKVVINKTAAIALGWNNPTDAIGEKLKIEDGDYEYIIQNVTEDFHFSSMKEQIQPVIFFNLDIFPTYRYLNFRIRSENIQSTISSIQSKWAELIPGSPFDYRFMDDSLNELYTSEVKFRKAIYNASLLSLIIVLLGIIGLVSLSAHKRIKEIGVRKVLGASVLNIVVLFIKEFITIIVIASAIAIPLSYYFMTAWLNNYVYRINISSKPFFISIVLLISITFLLIGLLSFNTAKANPIKSLKTE